MNFLKKMAVLFVVAITFATQSAFAGVAPWDSNTNYFEYTKPSGGAGGIDYTRAQYNQQNGVFNLNYDFNNGADTFWLVVTPTDNPTGSVDQYVILYGDIKENRITAYAYDGQNSDTSYLDKSKYIATFNNVIQDDGKGFHLDTKGLNSAFSNPEWKGLQFDDKAGIWFHTGVNGTTTYNRNRTIKDFDLGINRSWVDSKVCDGPHDKNCGIPTSPTPVDAPASLGIMTLAIAGLMLRRKMNKTA